MFISDDLQTVYNDKVGGYGFACFVHLVGFILAISAALYISPLISSANEKLTLAQPQNFKYTDTESQESYGGARAPPITKEPSAPIQAVAKPKTEHLSKFATVNEKA